MIRSRFSLPHSALVAGLAVVVMTLSSCGDGGIGNLAGGGTGGTGISTGPITGFGSVHVDGAVFKTDDEVAPGFETKKVAKGVDHSNARDRDLFRVGMVVTVHHGADDNNASEIDYEPRLRGPIASKVAGSAPAAAVLGRTVLVDDAALFASLDVGNVVEVDGFVDDRGRIRATYVDVTEPAAAAGEEFELSGYVAAADPSAGTFDVASLPDGVGEVVAVSYSPDAVRDLPSGPSDGMYVRITTLDAQPVNGALRATGVHPASPRTSFPEGASVDLDGLVTGVSSVAGTVVSFDLEGKRVQTAGSTVFIGGAATDIRSNARVLAHGNETGGILSAGRILFR